MENFRDPKTGQFKKGEKPINFKGWYIGSMRGGKLKYKFIYAPEHPFAASRKKYVMEHRLVMEKYIGRYLTPEEQVHHINEDTLDNRIENLQLCANNTEHKKLHRTRIEITEKACTLCKQIKPKEDFPFRLNSPNSPERFRYYSSWCYSCCRAKNRESRHRHTPQ